MLILKNYESANILNSYLHFLFNNLINKIWKFPSVMWWSFLQALCLCTHSHLEPNINYRVSYLFLNNVGFYHWQADVAHFILIGAIFSKIYFIENCLNSFFLFRLPQAYWENEYFFKMERGGGSPSLAAAKALIWLSRLPKIYFGGPVG